MSETKPASTTPGSARQVPVAPYYSIDETDNGWTLTVSLPGADKSGLSVNEQDGVLTIHAERAWKRPSNWTAISRESTDAPYELTLQHEGVDIEKTEASFADGILKVNLAKAEELRPRKIEVK